MVEAKLYRDSEYGALGVVRKGANLLTADHGFNAHDFDAVLAVLERSGAENVQGEGVSLWKLTAHPEAVLSNIDTALRAKGYREGKLHARAAFEATEDQVLKPDLPTEPRGYRIHETVERAMRRPVEALFNELKVEAADIRFFPRSSVRDNLGRPLPMLRARGFVRAGDPAVTEAKLAVVLQPLAGQLTRLSAAAAGSGRMVIEFALSPPREVVEKMLNEALPVFTETTFFGAREVRFVLGEPMTEADRKTIEERAIKSKAALSLVVEGERMIVARVPSSTAGDHLTDWACSERLRWLGLQLAGWAPDLQSVGESERSLT